MEPRAVDAGHGWTWISGGFRLFLKSPAIWLALLVVLFVCTKILGYVPVLGLVFVLFIPVFVAGLMDGCRALERGEPLKVGHLLVGFRRNAAQLVTLGGVSLVVNLGVLMLVMTMGGDAMSTLAKTLAQNPAITPEIAEQIRPAVTVVGRALLLATLLSLPFLMALWYAPLLVYLHDLGAVAAMKSSFFACLKNSLPLLVYGLVILGGMFIVMPFSLALGQHDLALWLLAPVVIPSLYVSYRDIYVDAATQPAKVSV